MRLMRAHSLATAIAALRSNPRVELLHIEPGRDEMQLFMHSIMSFSAGRELLEYGRDSGRTFFASGGAAILRANHSSVSGSGAQYQICGGGPIVTAPFAKCTWPRDETFFLRRNQTSITQFPLRRRSK
jgi:hypothetical protein